jgi:hypothetical protein
VSFEFKIDHAVKAIFSNHSLSYLQNQNLPEINVIVANKQWSKKGCCQALCWIVFPSGKCIFALGFEPAQTLASVCFTVSVKWYPPIHNQRYSLSAI